MAATIKQLKGLRFGKLVVLEATARRSAGSVKWLCLCDCGNKVEVSSGNLRSGHTLSCGCHKKEATGKTCKRIFTKHGHGKTKAQTPTYRSWLHMKDRCNNPNNTEYKNYGGRGIKVCERWCDYSNFFADMGERPKGKTLDRKDVNGNYEPSNCQWATNKEQGNNKRTNRLIEYNGEIQTITRLAEKYKVRRSNLYYRLSHGYTVEEAIKKI